MNTTIRDPYQSGLITQRPSSIRVAAPVRVVGVLDSRRSGRGLQLIHPRTRCIRQNDIHELIVTDERAQPGGEVNAVQYLGFFEFLEGCVLVEGDRLVIDGRSVAEIVGFDETHMPNHYNIVLYAPRMMTGVDLGLSPNDKAHFVPWNLKD